MADFCAAKGYLSSAGRKKFHFEMVEICHFTSASSFYVELGDWAGRQDMSIGKCCAQRLPVILGGGGGVLFDRLWQVPLIKRSMDAPSNPGKWTIPTGRFETFEELISPDLMIRELWEELLACQDGAIVCLQDIVSLVDFEQTSKGFSLERMDISYQGYESHFYGWISLSKLGELNTIVPALTNQDLAEYHFVDGEFDDNGNRLEREIVLCEVKGKNIICELPVTEHATVAIENISMLYLMAMAN